MVVLYSELLAGWGWGGGVGGVGQECARSLFRITRSTLFEHSSGTYCVPRPGYDGKCDPVWMLFARHLESLVHHFGARET